MIHVGHKSSSYHFTATFNFPVFQIFIYFHHKFLMIRSPSPLVAEYSRDSLLLHFSSIFSVFLFLSKYLRPERAASLLELSQATLTTHHRLRTCPTRKENSFKLMGQDHLNIYLKPNHIPYHCRVQIVQLHTQQHCGSIISN